MKVKTFFRSVKEAAILFMDTKGMKLCASLSYYTIFSLGPLLIIIISLAGIFYGREAVRGEVYEELFEIIGENAAIQVQNIIQNIENTRMTGTGLTLGIIILLFGASGVFTEIQDSINTIWSVKAKPQKGWLKFIFNRLLSFSLIISIGFILLVSLILSTLLDVVYDRLMNYFPDTTLFFASALNLLIPFIIISILFIIIFKILPDAKVGWKEVMMGAIFTAILFLIGKFAIGLYIKNSSFNNTYGAASSIVILLTWVYYSSIILYFGAAFTKCYTMERGKKIIPKKTAVLVEQKEIEREVIRPLS
ncbi:YihY/virulence factor BrkB family protein [Gynurincola endophyticus]|jgi:membrane protein|uniref:YihY/virulence factor BrkB family protein n=1 Tax=Gynurincola endophyticus TaxID=2479004 RepID=UPI000F8D4F70|nr:YihY/virulence factor BrkB family protein [Gynurincola endophyticus]